MIGTDIIEVSRIEKLIKRKFPGLRKNMFKGYSELLERDFFGSNGRELTSYKLIDRLNLHFKIGSQISVPFSDDELKIVKRIENLDSYDDVLSCVRDIYDAEASETDKDEIEEPNTDSEETEETDDVENSSDSSNSSDSPMGGALSPLSIEGSVKPQPPPVSLFAQVVR